MVCSCNFEMAAAPDSLDSLFHHFIDAHPSVHTNGKWPNLVELVFRGVHVKPNTQYWPPSTLLGDLQHLVAVTKPSATQLQSPIVAARWAASENFHKGVVSRRRSYRRAQHKESKNGERSSLASKDAPKALSESGAHFPNQPTSGLSSATLLMKLLLPPGRLRHLARKEAKAVEVQVAQRTPNPRLVL